jgi:hypothetical protein
MSTETCHRQASRSSPRHSTRDTPVGGQDRSSKKGGSDSILALSLAASIARFWSGALQTDCNRCGDRGSGFCRFRRDHDCPASASTRRGDAGNTSKGQSRSRQGPRCPKRSGRSQQMRLRAGGLRRRQKRGGQNVPASKQNPGNCCDARTVTRQTRLGKRWVIEPTRCLGLRRVCEKTPFLT